MYLSALHFLNYFALTFVLLNMPCITHSFQVQKATLVEATSLVYCTKWHICTQACFYSDTYSILLQSDDEKEIPNRNDHQECSTTMIWKNNYGYDIIMWWHSLIKEQLIINSNVLHIWHERFNYAENDFTWCDVISKISSQNLFKLKFILNTKDCSFKRHTTIKK